MNTTTKTAQFTPGPWKAVPDKSRNMYTWYVEGAKGVVPTIARLSLIDACEEIESNAHLIAAAPVMYGELSVSTNLLCRALPYLPDAVAKELVKQRQINMQVLSQAEGQHHE